MLMVKDARLVSLEGLCHILAKMITHLNLEVLFLALSIVG